MKLPKQFGGGGFQQALAKAQGAMARAKNIESELESERIDVDKGPVKAVFNGTGQMVSISIDKEAAEDAEMLEDLVLGAVRDGFDKATEMRNKKIAEITKDLPPGMGF